MRTISSWARTMGEQQLRAWLAPSGEQRMSDAELRLLLDVNTDGVPAASMPSMLFALALLRDLYADDADVRAWLARPRPEFQWRTAGDLLRGGRAHEVETLLIRLWNSPLVPQRRRPTYLRRTGTT